MSGARVLETALFRRNSATLLVQLVARGVTFLTQLAVGGDVPRGINPNDLFQLRFIFVPASPEPARARPAGLFLVRVRNSSCNQCRCKSTKYASVSAP